MQTLESAIPARYENGFIVSVGSAVAPEDVQWIEDSGFDLVETNIRGWGEYNAIISVGYGSVGLSTTSPLSHRRP